ncbi:hypothetical protein SDC9_166144 [bioreactor metagenome]|uniref:Uncharacterized protein n=1 Tax=bioreactor metagenome TaxID=1076179 RepID=A0A645FW68_9ZZZZ
MAVRPGADIPSIEPNLCVGHCTVEVDIHPLILFLVGYRKIFPVPADSLVGQFSGPTFQFDTEGAGDCPVVGQIQLLPTGIIGFGFFKALRFRQGSAVGL